jgi:hypothetical protein
MSGVIAFRRKPDTRSVTAFDQLVAPAPTDVTPPPVPVILISALPQEIVDLFLYTGDDFSMTLTFTNPDGSIANLTGSSVKSQIRTTAADVMVAASFICSISANVVTLSLTSASCQNLVGDYVWDCQITNVSGAVRTPVAGTVTFTQDVTR